MKEQLKRISRKTFFKQIAIVLSIPYVYLALKTILWHKNSQAIKEIRLPIDLGKDILFDEHFIYIKKDNAIRFFSSKCTHLGCKISTLKEDELACGCHGSHFALNGKVLKGPAAKNLQELEYSIDNDTQEYIIQLG